MHPQSQGDRRAQLARTVAAVGLALSLALSGAITASAAPLEVPTGLSQLLTTYAPTASVRGIAEFGSVPTSAQVASLKALGLVVPESFLLRADKVIE